MFYLYCTACHRITKGKKSGVFGGSLTCTECGASVKASRCDERTCERCGVSLFAPKPVHVFPECPCKAEEASALPEPAPAAEEAPPAPAIGETPPVIEEAQPAFPPISCPRCAALLESEDGTYGPCPVCGMTPPAQYVSQQLYFKSGKGRPIEIKWNPGEDELVYVHHHASHIPANSLLIVNPGQTAVYVSGGQRVALETGQTYALFDEERDVGAIARAVNEGTLTRPPLGLMLNTQIIFFDNRLHELTVPIESRIAGGAWSVELSATLFFRISDAQTLLGHALNLRDCASVSIYLKKRVAEAFSGLITEALGRIAHEKSSEWTGDGQTVLNDIAGMVNPRLQPLIALANHQLEGFGLLIDRAEMQYHRATRTNSR